MKIISLSAFFTTIFGALGVEKSLNNKRNAAPRTVSLGLDGMLRLNRDSRIGCIKVRKGMVWLTGSPGRADVLLGKGDLYPLNSDWPFVAQALEMAEIDLLPAASRSTKGSCCVA